MCPLTVTALLGLAAGCPPPPGPSDLLAPADPAIHERWTPPPPPTAGSRRYVPVEATAQGWLDGGAAHAKRPGTTMPPMDGMPGMSGHGP